MISIQLWHLISFTAVPNEDADKNTPTPKRPNSQCGETPDPKKSIGNVGDLPSGTTFAYKESSRYNNTR